MRNIGNASKESDVEMTISAAKRYMRNEHDQGVGRRYPERVRAAVGKAIREARAAGATWASQAEQFGLPLLTARKWGIAAGAPFIRSPEKRPGGRKKGGKSKAAKGKKAGGRKCGARRGVGK